MPEYWDVYDARRRPTGAILPRGVSIPGDAYALAVNVWIRNPAGQWLMTRRAPGKSEPLKWEPPGGHVLAGEDSRSAAVREVLEEVGLALDPKAGRLFASYRRREVCWENPGFLDIWVFEADPPISALVPREGEVTEAKWAFSTEILHMIDGGEFVPTAQFPYYRDLFRAYPERHTEEV